MQHIELAQNRFDRHLQYIYTLYIYVFFKQESIKIYSYVKRGRVMNECTA